MLITSIVFLILFIVVSIAHLIFNYFKIEKYRRITKPFCLFFLGLSALFYRIDLPLIYIACFSAMIGDILLIPQKKKICFALGALFFISEHIFLFIAQTNLFSNYSHIYTLCAIFFIFIFAYMGINKRHTPDKIKRYAAYCFFGFHFINIILAIVILSIFDNLLMHLVIFGYLIYFISDFLISYNIFYHDFKKRHFIVMLTYLTAQPMIIYTLLNVL